MLHLLRTLRRVRTCLPPLPQDIPVHSQLTTTCSLLLLAQHPPAAPSLRACPPVLAWQPVRHMGRFTRRPAQEQRERERLQELESTERTPCNWDIQTEEVRLVGEGKEHSIMKLKDAIERAQQQELDLVQVGGDANYPACRIMSFKDFAANKRDKAKELRRKVLAQRRVQDVKEVRVSPVIAEHDLAMKLAAVERFLAKGNKVKLVVHAKGMRQRQGAAQTLAMLQQQLEERLGGKADISQTVKTERALRSDSDEEEEDMPKHGVHQLSLMLQPKT